jgi:hypothetical protein
MAIKVGGTTVINDSRALTNITSVDATTVAALGTSGVGGGGTHEFTASSALTSGQAAVLQSNGQVKPVALTVGTLTSTDIPQSMGGQTQNNDVAYQANEFNMVNVYTDPSSGYLIFGNHTRASDGGLTHRGDSTIRSQACDYSRIAYNPDRGMCLALYASGSGYNDVKASTFFVNASGGREAPVTIELDNLGNYTGSSLCYDESLNKFVGVFQRSDETWVFLIEQAANGSLTKTASANLNLGTSRQQHVATNHNGQFVILGADTENDTVSAMTFSVSGNTITAGSVTTVASSAIDNTYGRSSLIYDPVNSAWLAAYYFRSGTTDWIYMKTITVSSNTATVGSSLPLINFSGNTSKGSVTLASDNVGGIVAFYGNDTNRLASKQITITNTGSGATGLTISTGSQVVLSDHSTSNPAHNYGFEVATSGDTHNTFVQYALVFNTQASAIKIEPAEKTISSDSSDFIGFADGAITQGASGKITHIGGVNENQSGLTANTDYYVGLSGALQTSDSGVLAGKALSATKILVKG